jgi:heterodisulfide reductase subunit B
MGLSEPYKGETNVLHYLEVLRDKVGFDKIAEAVKNPLTGKKIGAYYGCLLLRPSGVLAFDSPENPTIIEDFISAIGGTPIKYPMRNECCGAYVSLKNEGVVAKRSNMVIESAKGFGAEEIITACPLCLYNLQKNSNGFSVKYFTELLAEALGVKDE